MIITEIYNGQGLGNQLWCYVVTRAIAKKHGYDFGIMHPEKFKCLDFMKLDFGKPVIGGSGPEGGPPTTLPEGITSYYAEKKITHPTYGFDIRTHDEKLMRVADNTKIDGYMQDEQYIIEYKNEIREWLKIKSGFGCMEYANENTCIINFRGGEYIGIRDVFLPQKYWDDAIIRMQSINQNMQFVVITDDISTAKKFFPRFPVYHFSIGKDYTIIQNAHYLILSNSSFAWFPAWLNQNRRYYIAPKYWAYYNVSDGYWGLGYAITTGCHYLDRKNTLFTYEECMVELKKYQLNPKSPIFLAPPIYQKRTVWLMKAIIKRKLILLIKHLLSPFAKMD